MKVKLDQASKEEKNSPDYISKKPSRLEAQANLTANTNQRRNCMVYRMFPLSPKKKAKNLFNMLNTVEN